MERPKFNFIPKYLQLIFILSSFSLWSPLTHDRRADDNDGHGNSGDGEESKLYRFIT